jgi:peroxiredoxin
MDQSRNRRGAHFRWEPPLQLLIRSGIASDGTPLAKFHEVPMTHRPFKGIAVSAAVLAVYLSLAVTSLAVTMAADVTAVPSGAAAPEFTKIEVNGTPVRLSDFKGKVVLLNFWATWFHSCKTEIPWFMEFQDQFKNAGLAAVGVSMDDDGWKSVTPFVAEKKLSYALVIGDKAFGTPYGLSGMPKTILIDRGGRIAATYQGVVDEAKCESDIRALLKEKLRGMEFNVVHRSIQSAGM